MQADVTLLIGAISAAFTGAAVVWAFQAKWTESIKASVTNELQVKIDELSKKIDVLESRLSAAQQGLLNLVADVDKLDTDETKERLKAISQAMEAPIK